MRDLLERLVETRKRGGNTAAGGDLHQAASPIAEDDHAIFAPRAASEVRRGVAQRGRRPASDLHFLELPVLLIRDEAAVRRPERNRVLGPWGYGPRLQRIQRTNPNQVAAFAAGRKRQLAAVRREEQRVIERGLLRRENLESLEARPLAVARESGGTRARRR